MLPNDIANEDTHMHMYMHMHMHIALVINNKCFGPEITFTDLLNS